MTPMEMIYDMEERCEQVWVMHRIDQDQDAAANAVGAVLQTLDGGMAAVEVALTPGGLATVTVRAFDAAGEPVPVGVLELDMSVMVTA